MKLFEIHPVGIFESDRQKMSPEDIKVLGGLKFYHGGTKFSGDTFDPTFFGRGEPGNLRPQGHGFYGGDTEQLAAVYHKYGEPGNQGTTEFRISEYALLYPQGAMWRKMSPEYTNRVKDALERATQLLRDRGLAEKDFMGREKDPMELYQRSGRGPTAKKIRQTLIDAGIDGSVTYLNDTYRNEIAMYNPAMVKRVSQ